MDIKRIIAVLLAASVLMSFAACGKKKAAATVQEDELLSTYQAALTPVPERTEGLGENSFVSDSSQSTWQTVGSTVCEHEELELVLKNATCTEGGSGSYVCADCGTALHTVETEPRGHRYGYVSDANGHWKECAVCGDKTATEQHTFNDNSVCTVCGYGCEHRFTDTVTAPTCLEPGYTTHVCDKCGYQTIDSYTAPAGHSYVGTVTKAATCTEPGEGVYTCSVCGDSFTAALPAEGHHAVVEPGEIATCQSTGLSQGSHCDLCGEVLVAQEVLPVTDHYYLDGQCIWCGKEAPEGEDNSTQDEWQLPWTDWR